MFPSLLIIALLIFFVWAYKSRNQLHIPVNVPGAKFILGHAHFFSDLATNDFENMALRLQNPKYGPITHIKYFFISEISLNTVKVAEGLLKSPQNVNKSFIYDCLRVLLPDSVLILPYSTWQQRRKMLTPSFHFATMEGFEQCMIKNANILVDIVSKDSNRPILEIISKVAFMTIMETSFGVEYQDPNECMHIIECIEYALHWIVERNVTIFAGRKWDWFYYKYTARGKNIMNRIQRLNSAVSKIIDDRKQLYELGDVSLYKGRRSFLDHLIHEQTKKRNISDEQILGECITIMVAGHETTTTAIGYVLYFLCKFPQVQQKVHDEIIQHLKGKNFSDLNVSDLKYLTMVVKESMRLQPPVGQISRELSCEYKVEGHVLPAGTQVALPIWWLHRDPEVWENPEIFDPERFSAENSKHRNPYAFVPFSAGPRGCLGQRFGMTEVKIMVAALVFYFHMSTKQEIGKDIFRKGILVKSLGSEFVIDFQPRN